MVSPGPPSAESPGMRPHAQRPGAGAPAAQAAGAPPRAGQPAAGPSGTGPPGVPGLAGHLPAGGAPRRAGLPAVPGARAGLPATAGDGKLTRLAADWLAEFGSAETRRAYARELRRFLAWCAGQEVDPLAARRGEVAAYARALERLVRPARSPTHRAGPAHPQGPGRAPAGHHAGHPPPGPAAVSGLAPASRARALAAVSSFYAYASDSGVIGHNPAARVRRPRLDRDLSATVALTEAEARALLARAAADRHGPPHRAHALVAVLLATGIRIGEAIRADTADLSYDRGHRILRVLRKGGRPGVVPLPPSALGALDTYLAARRDLAGCHGPDGRVETARAPAGLPLFATATGGRLAQSEAWRLIRRLAGEAGLPAAGRLSPHSLRATCATLARVHGAELADLQDLLGHADPRTTRRYDKARDNLDRSPAYLVAALFGTDGPRTGKG